MSRNSMVLAGALVLALMGVGAAVAQADQLGPGSADSWWQQMEGHHGRLAGEGWQDEMKQMMRDVHGVDADEWERHWDEMTEWMDGFAEGGFDAGDMEMMRERLHGPGFGPGVHGSGGRWVGEHCGGGAPQ